jgi:acyl homoserine lactone synthase
VIVVIERYNANKYARLMDQMFQLRARVFHERLKWDVVVTDGKERDGYDDLSPVYIVDTDDEAREVKGCLRLLPTTGPTLLTDFFSDTVPPAANLSDPTIWECTRFCLDDAILKKGRRDELLYRSAVLVSALGNVAMKAGIDSIIGNFDSSMLRLYRSIGCDVEVLGATHRYGRPVYLGSFAVSKSVLSRIKSHRGEMGSADMAVLAA